MNLNNIAAFVNDDVTTVSVVFPGNAMKQYTFKVMKDLAKTLQKDSLVLVDTVHGISIGTVEAVHEDNQIELNSSTIYKWCFAAVSLEALAGLKAKEAHVTKLLKEKQKAKYKEEVIKALGLDNDVLQLIGK